MASVFFEIYKNGKLQDFVNYSSKDLELLEDSLDKIVDIPGKWLKETKSWAQPYFFSKVNFPEEGTVGKVTFTDMGTQTPMNAPQQWLEKFLGTRIHVPSSGSKVIEIHFTAVSKIRIAETV